MSTIGINPHDVSETPGNVFAFKIIEYLAAGTHVITTPMGPLEKELEAGITYLPDNSPETIAAGIRRVITEGEYERRASEAAQSLYGPAAVATSLNSLLDQVAAVGNREPMRARASRY
jgi:glycosyltransferase involved in cell wall biosynthesis